jgi:hypothetical protein
MFPARSKGAIDGSERPLPNSHRPKSAIFSRIVHLKALKFIESGVNRGHATTDADIR